MKKSVKIILITAAVITVLALAGTGGYIVYKTNQGIGCDIDAAETVGSSVEIIEEDSDSVTIRKNDDSDFKVILFTDTHLNGNKDDELTVKYLIENIQKKKPDLVIFGGDNVSSAFSKKRTEDFVRLMDKLGVYWAAVLGNHDGEGALSYSRKEIIDLYASSQYCLARQGAEDIDGNGNYTVNILNSDGSLREVFFFLDSGDYMSNELKEQYNIDKSEFQYDGVKESQVQWYKDKHDEIEDEYGSFKSITVVHIPPYQVEELSNGKFIYGEKREDVCESGFDSGLVDAITEKGSTRAVYFGHDHINDFGVFYNGILFSYIQSSGYGSYNMGTQGAPEDEWLQGCTILNIKKNGTYETVRRLNHAK